MTLNPSREPQKDWHWPKSVFCENRENCSTIKRVLEQNWPDCLIESVIRETCEHCGEIPVE